MRPTASGNLKKGAVLWLALKDLRHETLVNINLILGSAAIIAPLLILFGIKFGTIETMRNRLLEDPRNLEIRQLSNQSYEKQWFSTIADDERVQFIMPLTRKLASTVLLSTKDGSQQIKADLMPTQANDPLVLRNGGRIPNENEALLSIEAAKALGVEAGDTLTLGVTRYINQKLEKETLQLTIASVLEPRASFLKTIFLPLELAEQIEKYKDGLAVEALGWKGQLSTAYPVYDGVFIALNEPLDRVEQIRLVSGTGFTSIDPITPKKAFRLSGIGFDENKTLYFVKPFKNRVQETNIKAVELKLRGKAYTLHRWIKPLEVQLVNDGNKQTVQLLAGKAGQLKDQILYMKGARSTKTNISLTIQERQLELSVTIEPIETPDLPGNTLLASPTFAGKLALFQERDLQYDETSSSLVLVRRGYAGFRIYAKTLEDVAPLKKDFESKGIAVSTQAERIHDVMSLDKYMTIIFWLIAIVGIIGGTATLSASLYSSVERKRRDLAVLRLLGLSKTALFRFPIYQGVIIAVSGVLTALFFYGLMATLINRLFSAYLGRGESFCTLNFSHMALVIGFAILIAVLSSTFAALKATRADPAEAMRDE